jgi:hexulose-6-phosphate isomerase
MRGELPLPTACSPLLIAPQRDGRLDFAKAEVQNARSISRKDGFKRMKTISRRQFIAATSVAVWHGHLAHVRAEKLTGGTPVPRQTRLKKALIHGLPDEKYLTSLKEAGYDGMESTAWNAEPAKAEEARKIADRLGLKIHCVMRAWTQFNDPKQFDAHVASVETALRTAQILGADAILLVPCRVGGAGMKIPKPRELQYEFDEKTNHIKRVVAGDNAPYDAYIAAHNQAIDASRAAYEKLIPVAEKTGVVIAHENVWNNLWSKPDVLANFVSGFKSRWLGVYYDIGNHVKYAPSEEWILKLGSLIKKCHVKDFKLNDDPGGDGKWANIRDGSIDWPAVRAALDKIGYTGWMTIEGGSCTMAEHSQRLDLIIAGK